MANEEDDGLFDRFIDRARAAGLPTDGEQRSVEHRLTVGDVLPRPGGSFMHWRVGDMIGHGSFGYVNLLQDSAGKALVLKWVTPLHMASPSVIAHAWVEMSILHYLGLAQREGRLLPGSVPQHEEHGEWCGVTFLVMERIQGETLADVILRQEKENIWSRREWLRFLVDVLLQICRTLEFCHREGIIHQDLKPSNLMLTKRKQDEGSEQWRAVLIDFGLAYAPPVISSISYQKGRMGTPGYIPPELARVPGESDAPISSKSDVFSLCATLCRGAYEKSVYGRGSEEVLLQRAVDGAIVLPEQLSGDPPGLWEIVERGTRVDPEARYANISDLIDALRLLQAGC